MTNEKLSEQIRLLQNIQKASHPDSQDWKFASRKLQPLFAEADRRQRNGEIVEDLDAYEQRVRQLEAEGCTRSDAQAVADAEALWSQS